MTLGVSPDLLCRQVTLMGPGRAARRLFEASTGTDGLVEAATRQPDVVIVDLGLPDLDGVEVIRRLREWISVAVIVLPSRGQESDKVAALDAGADDYVSKPFGPGELLARVRVAVRHAARTATGEDATFTVGDLRVDFARRQVFIDGKEVHLTPIEYKLLTALVRHAGKVLTHAQLLKEVWGPSHESEAPYLRIYIMQLRRKLEANPTRPRYQARRRFSDTAHSCDMLRQQVIDE